MSNLIVQIANFQFIATPTVSEVQTAVFLRRREKSDVSILCVLENVS